MIILPVVAKKTTAAIEDSSNLADPTVGTPSGTVAVADKNLWRVFLQKNLETGCAEPMRRFLVFILWSSVFLTVGFFFVPPSVRAMVTRLVTECFYSNSDSPSARTLPLLVIDNVDESGSQRGVERQIATTPAEELHAVYGELAPALPLEQAINFQMTIDRIVKNWPQVSTGIKEDGLFGYRVPFVSGTEESDITGALTYFFGSDRILYRIDFKGDTGDARKLIHHVTQAYKMQRQNSAEQGVYLFQTPGDVQAVGELRICPRTIIHHARPHQRFELSLQLSRFYSDSVEL